MVEQTVLQQQQASSMVPQQQKMATDMNTYRNDPQWMQYQQTDTYKKYNDMKMSNPSGYKETTEYATHRSMKTKVKDFFKSKFGSSKKAYRDMPEWKQYMMSDAFKNYSITKKNNPKTYKKSQDYFNHLALKNKLKGKPVSKTLKKAYKQKPEWNSYILSSDYSNFRQMKMNNPSGYKTTPQYQTHLMKKNSIRNMM